MGYMEEKVHSSSQPFLNKKCYCNKIQLHSQLYSPFLSMCHFGKNCKYTSY